jgi:hypothetical protein
MEYLIELTFQALKNFPEKCNEKTFKLGKLQKLLKLQNSIYETFPQVFLMAKKIFHKTQTKNSLGTIEFNQKVHELFTLFTRGFK